MPTMTRSTEAKSWQLLLPSIWEEPLARIMQEGLAAGMVVIGAATGGTKEIIVHGENGLLFPAADAAACAGHQRHPARQQLGRPRRPRVGAHVERGRRNTCSAM